MFPLPVAKTALQSRGEVTETERWKVNEIDEPKPIQSSAALLMIQNKHLTKANIIDWSYIYGADKIFI